MTVLARAIVYSALFIGLLLVFIPARVLSAAGVTRPTSFDVPQLAGETYCRRVRRWLPGRPAPSRARDGA